MCKYTLQKRKWGRGPQAPPAPPEGRSWSGAGSPGLRCSGTELPCALSSVLPALTAYMWAPLHARAPPEAPARPRSLVPVMAHAGDHSMKPGGAGWVHRAWPPSSCVQAGGRALLFFQLGTEQGHQVQAVAGDEQGGAPGEGPDGAVRAGSAASLCCSSEARGSASCGQVEAPGAGRLSTDGVFPDCCPGGSGLGHRGPSGGSWSQGKAAAQVRAAGYGGQGPSGRGSDRGSRALWGALTQGLPGLATLKFVGSSCPADQGEA